MSDKPLLNIFKKYDMLCLTNAEIRKCTITIGECEKILIKP